MASEIGVDHVGEIGGAEEPNEHDADPHAKPPDGVGDACDELRDGWGYREGEEEQQGPAVEGCKANEQNGGLGGECGGKTPC